VVWGEGADESIGEKYQRGGYLQVVLAVLEYYLFCLNSNKASDHDGMQIDKSTATK